MANCFWLEHIIPFSSSWVDEIDTDRFGNTIPIIDTLNNKRKTKHISEYKEIEKQLNIDFIRFLKHIIPSYDTYDSIVVHEGRKPKVINKENYDILCKKNEDEYKHSFLKYVFNVK
jgi:hypothetical protein